MIPEPTARLDSGGRGPRAPEPPHRRDRIRNVACATDFSGPAETALWHALAIARADDARLHLVHTWDDERIAEMSASIERELGQQREATRSPALPILRVTQSPPHEAVRLAIEVEADRLVGGRHRTGRRPETSDRHPSGEMEHDAHDGREGDEQDEQERQARRSIVRAGVIPTAIRAGPASSARVVARRPRVSHP